jgi:ribose transport system substrate-binding protein
MSTRTRRLSAAALATAAVMAVAACGSNDADDPAEETAAQEAATDAADADAATDPATGIDADLAAGPGEQELVESAGQVDDTSFCGEEDIVLGIHDAFGINAWSQASLTAVRAEADRCDNVETIVEVGQGDLQQSISQIDSMVSQGVTALVAVPSLGQAQLPSLQAATNAGVSVVPWAAYPGGEDGADYVSYVDWDPTEAGRQWAQWMVDTLGGEGQVIFIGGPAGNPVTTAHLAGIVEVFEANPGMELLTGTEDWPATNWDPAQAQQVMSSLLGRYERIDGLISDYGTDALAALRAMEAAGRPLVPVATIEANGLACLWQEQGEDGDLELATISSRNWLGRIAARKAIAAAQGLDDTAPSIFALPLFEDSVNGPDPICESDRPDDFYVSNQLTPDQIAEFGTP